MEHLRYSKNTNILCEPGLFLSGNLVTIWQMHKKSYMSFVLDSYRNLNNPLVLHGSFPHNPKGDVSSGTIFSTWNNPMSMKNNQPDLTACEDNMLQVYDPWPSLCGSSHRAQWLLCTRKCMKALMTPVWLWQLSQWCINVVCVCVSACICLTGERRGRLCEMGVCVYDYNPWLLNYKSLQLLCTSFLYPKSLC